VKQGVEMKNLLLNGIALLFTVQTTFSQWIEQNSGVKDNLVDVCFVDSLNGWALAEKGFILHTNDGGLVWEKQIFPDQTDQLYKVQFSDINNGAVIGSFGTFMLTNNGGNTWQELTFPYKGNINDLYYMDSLNLWTIGWGYILHSSDGGYNWEKQLEMKITDSTFHVVFTGIKFFDKNTGYAIAKTPSFDMDEPNYFYTTDDGGKNWNNKGIIKAYVDAIADSGTPSVSYGINFISKENIWLWGLSGLVNTSDAGLSWKYFSPSTYTPTDVCILSGEKVIAAFSGNSSESSKVYYSEDNGKNWEINFENPYPKNTLRAFASVNDKKIWVVGENGIILINNFNTTNVKEDKNKLISFSLKQNYPNPFNYNTHISFTLTKLGYTKLLICDMKGSIINTLFSNLLKAGDYTIQWNGINTVGQIVSSGVYLLNLYFNSDLISKKMILLK